MKTRELLLQNDDFILFVEPEDGDGGRLDISDYHSTLSIYGANIAKLGNGIRLALDSIKEAK